MRLNNVTPGVKFSLNNIIYIHDFDGRSGGGKVAVRNLDTDTPEMIPGTTDVVCPLPSSLPEMDPTPIAYNFPLDEDYTESVTMESRGKVWTPNPGATPEEDSEARRSIFPGFLRKDKKDDDKDNSETNDSGN